MRITLNDIQYMINESVKHILAEKRVDVISKLEVDFDTLVENLPDGDLKAKLLDDYDDSYYFEVESLFKDNYVLKFSAVNIRDNGDYFTPPINDFEKVMLSSDDGLLDDITKIDDESIKNDFMSAYKKITDTNKIEDWEDEDDYLY